MNRAIVRTSDPARQPHVHATTASAPADSDVYDTGFFLRSLSHVIEIARFYWSAGVRCDIIETRVTCHDSPGIRDRMREGRRSRMVIVSGSAGRMSTSVYTMAAPRICLARCLRDMEAHSSRVMSPDEWNRTPWRIWAKASWRHTVGCTRAMDRSKGSCTFKFRWSA